MLVLLDHLPDHDPGRHHVDPRHAPQGAQRDPQTKPENIVLSVDVRQHLLERAAHARVANALTERLKKIAVLSAAGVQIRGDGGADYDGVGRIIYAAARRDRQGRLHHGAAAASWRAPDSKLRYGNERRKLRGSGEPDVLIEINTTPLIDVMLVLLVMLIITLPIQLHSVNLNMPVGIRRRP